MKTVFYFFICLTLCMATHVQGQKKEDLYKATIAWNEDTVNSYKIALVKGGYFYYNIKDSIHKTEAYYKGKFSLATDTLCLKFNKDIPKGIMPYMILEASGGYLIQYFNDGRKRQFLKQQQTGRHHMGWNLDMNKYITPE